MEISEFRFDLVGYAIAIAVFVMAVGSLLFGLRWRRWL